MAIEDIGLRNQDLLPASSRCTKVSRLPIRALSWTARIFHL